MSGFAGGTPHPRVRVLILGCSSSFRRLFWCGLLIAFACCPPIFAQDDPEDSPVTIGVMLDDASVAWSETWREIDGELRALFAAIRPVEPALVVVGDGTAASLRRGYRELAANPEVDAIVSIGLLSAAVLSGEREYPKPVIGLGVFDPVVQGFLESRGNTSGIHNLTYSLPNAPLSADLAFFREVVPFEKIALLFGSEVFAAFDSNPESGKIDAQDLGLEGVGVSLVSVGPDIDRALADIPAEADAVYLGFFPSLTDAELKRLLDGIVAKKLPSFTLDLETLAAGGMLSAATEADSRKVARRTALNLEAILVDGVNAKDLPVLLTFEQRLTLNMEVVRAIDYPIGWDVLTRAELMNDGTLNGGREIDLKTVFLDAMSGNLTIRAEQEGVASTERNVPLAKASLWPSVSVGGTGLLYDPKTSRSSIGSIAELTWTGSASINQVVFDEPTLANVTIQRELLDAARQGLDVTIMDTLLEISSSYFDVLTARAILKTRSNDLMLTRRNLETAKLRAKVGYTGLSDVYRWESQLVSANQDVIDARLDLNTQMNTLNQVLSLDQEDLFRIRAENNAERELLAFYTREFTNYLDTPQDTEILVGFMLTEAQRHLPELKQLDASIRASERQLKSNRRALYLPSASLAYAAAYELGTAGIGSEFDTSPNNSVDWTATLSFSVPLFQGGTLRETVAQTRIDLMQQRTERAELLQKVELRLRSAVNSLVASHFNLESSKKAAEWALKSLELVQENYAKGAVSISDLLDAQNAYLDSAESEAIAEYGFLGDILTLERALGSYSVFDDERERDAELSRFHQYLIDRERSRR